MEVSTLELQKVNELLKDFIDKNGTIAERTVITTNCAGGRCSGSCTGSCKGGCSGRCKEGCYGACKGGCSGRAKRYV